MSKLIEHNRKNHRMPIKFWTQYIICYDRCTWANSDELVKSKVRRTSTSKTVVFDVA